MNGAKHNVEKKQETRKNIIWVKFVIELIFWNEKVIFLIVDIKETNKLVSYYQYLKPFF